MEFYADKFLNFLDGRRNFSATEKSPTFGKQTDNFLLARICPEQDSNMSTSVK